MGVPHVEQRGQFMCFPGFLYPIWVPFDGSIGASAYVGTLAPISTAACQQATDTYCSEYLEEQPTCAPEVRDARVAYAAPMSESARRRLRRQKAQHKQKGGNAPVPPSSRIDHIEAVLVEIPAGVEAVDPKALSDEIQARADDLVNRLACAATRDAAVASAAGLATANGASSRVVQLALAGAPSKDAMALAKGLQGHVRTAINDLSGNYVIQKIIETMPADVAKFVAKELRGYGVETARSKTGCRVLCRLLEHVSPNDDQLRPLVDEILSSSDPKNPLQTLIRHNYANYVCQHIIEFGLPQQKARVFQALLPLLPSAAEHRNASHVIEKLLGFCSPDEKEAVLAIFLQDPAYLKKLAEHESGCYVVKGLLRMPELSQRVADLLRPCAADLKMNKFGRRVSMEIVAALGTAASDCA